MYITARLRTVSYKPLNLELGMFFLRRIPSSQEREYFVLKQIPLHTEEFLIANGYPVELHILDFKNDVLASAEEIGWFDEGEHSDSLHDITIKEINTIFNRDGGFLEIDVDEEFISIYQQEKVVIRYITQTYG